ncbi:hypothetical protein Tcan_12005 [Toxocara canis]|uniref:Uncharacterized protein n=1 Tax=Toxocara canis TaxID=6265 RepID=A0A0B2UVM1_TOXCA|nr:hypothetical protein Tcan_12005 [Toxocara canis]
MTKVHVSRLQLPQQSLRIFPAFRHRAEFDDSGTHGLTGAVAEMGTSVSSSLESANPDDSCESPRSPDRHCNNIHSQMSSKIICLMSTKRVENVSVFNTSFSTCSNFNDCICDSHHRSQIC